MTGNCIVIREVSLNLPFGIGASKNSVGGIAIAVLNNGLRPFLAKWHPLLQAWEAKRPPSLSPKEHEQQWSDEVKLRDELNKPCYTINMDCYCERGLIKGDTLILM